MAICSGVGSRVGMGTIRGKRRGRLRLLLGQHEANIPFTLVKALSADEQGA
jgi:hypothetical protein